MRGGKSGPLLVAGKSAESLLVQRIAGLGTEKRMPLEDDPLTDEQIGLIRAWIDQGAKWPDGVGSQATEVKKHWAYVAPTLAAAAERARCRLAAERRSTRSSWPGLEKEGLAPSPPADRERLIRRASLDLVGLPPSVAEVDAFLADQSPDAYERLIDRLLASPRYGERWATPWLDAARYADSNGYQRDGHRTIWPYRDWVIRALNADMPFDQFTIEQIAGDLLPDGHARPADRHRLSPLHDGQRRSGHRRGGEPHEPGDRPRERDRHGLAGHDARMLPVPQPQVRPVHAARLLPVLRVLQQHAQGDLSADEGLGRARFRRPGGRACRSIRAVAKQRRAARRAAASSSPRSWSSAWTTKRPAWPPGSSEMADADEGREGQAAGQHPPHPRPLQPTSETRTSRTQLRNYFIGLHPAGEEDAGRDGRAAKAARRARARRVARDDRAGRAADDRDLRSAATSLDPAKKSQPATPRMLPPLWPSDRRRIAWAWPAGSSIRPIR